MNLWEINQEIERLERSETTYPNCEKLSILYQVRNNAQKPQETHVETRASVNEYSYAPAPQNASEFVTAFSAAPYEDAIGILDEHMAVIKALYPKEYGAILRKLKALQ